MINHKATRMAKDEEINTDYKRRIWKIKAKLFNMRKPWCGSFNACQCWGKQKLTEKEADFLSSRR